MKNKLGLIAIFLSATLSSSSINANEILNEDTLQKAYMLGAFHSLEQLNRNFKVQGMNKDKIEFHKFIIALDIQNMPTYKLMIYQQIGYSESLTPVIVNDKYLVFGSYDRKADAVYLQEKVLNSFHFKSNDEKAILLENNNASEWFKSQFVQKELFDTLIAETNKNVKGKVYVVQESNEELEKKLNTLDQFNKKAGIPSIPPVQTTAIVLKTKFVAMKNTKPSPTPVKEVHNTTKFKLKYKAQFYRCGGDWKKEVLADASLTPSYFSKAMQSKDYRFLTSKMTSSGFEFVKLYDSNLWVNKNDIEIIN